MACLSSCSEDDGLAGFPHLQPGARDGKPESQWRGAKNPWAGILGVLASSRGGSEPATPEAVVEEPVEEPVQEIVEEPKRKRNSGKKKRKKFRRDADGILEANLHYSLAMGGDADDEA